MPDYITIIGSVVETRRLGSVLVIDSYVEPLAPDTAILIVSPCGSSGEILFIGMNEVEDEQ